MAGILIVDDQVLVRKRVSKMLTAEGYRIAVTETADAAWEGINSCHPDMVLLNSLSNRFDGFELLLKIKSEYPKIPVLVYVIKSVDAIDKLKEAVIGVLSENRPFELVQK